MNNLTQSLHAQKIQAIAQELEGKNYSVTIEPSKDDLPFDLGNYHPDLMATKNGGGIILEVKNTLKRLSVDRFQEIAETVRLKSGWRFWLVTLDDTEDNLLDNDLPSWDMLESRLANLETLIQLSLLEPAFLLAWTILEPALRKRAIADHLPINRFPLSQLLDHSYSSGEISMEQFDLFKKCLPIRNKIVHGFSVSMDSGILSSLNQTIQSLIQESSETD